MHLNATIDHTLLKPDATVEQIDRLCAEAREHVFASVCVLPWYVERAADMLADSPVATCTVIGFPLGGTFMQTKVAEAMLAMDHGATELDMVINISALKSGRLDVVEADIAAVVSAVHGRKGIVKVIVETCLLTEAEKIGMCHIVTRTGADYIKTSTGFSTGGATLDDVRLLRANIGADVHVKASGGIRDRATAEAMLEAGASRLGTSAGVAIVRESH